MGVPRGPFTVWTRSPKDAPKRARIAVSGDSIPFVTWGPVEAGCVRVTCRPLDPSSPVAVYLFRTGEDADYAVAAGSVQPVNADPLSITVRTSGATYAKVWNGTDISVAIQPLADIVDDPNWKPLEVVGLDLEVEDRVPERLHVVANDARHHGHRTHLPERPEDREGVGGPHAGRGWYHVGRGRVWRVG